mgnify:FL=1|jgi:hypothetical protein
MIKLEHTVLPSPDQMQFVIEGIRNPMNSWNKSDSGYQCVYYCEELCNAECTGDDLCPRNGEYKLGYNDRTLMLKLAKSGTDHRKYMRMMPVYVRITAPLYWWKEFDTYKVGTVANSCSTMHRIAEKEFTWDDFSHDHLDVRTRRILEETIKALNDYRKMYVNYNPDDFEINGCPSKKDIWWQMIQLLPSSYNQTRNVMLNYEVLANIHKSRQNHKLDEWRDFCDWIETLPYSDLITGKETK